MKEEVKNGIIISIVVILIIAIVYFVTAIFMTEEIGGNKEKIESEEEITESLDVSSTYDNMIIAGKTFSQKDMLYKVIFFSNNDASSELKDSISSYANEEEKLYKVNLDEAINKFVISDEENPAATESTELKINGTTLIEISNGKIISYISDENEIISNLK